LKSGYGTCPLVEIQLHPGHCYLRARHGYERSEEHQVKR